MFKLRELVFAISAAAVLCSPLAAHAQITTVHSFHNKGAYPDASLVTNGGGIKLYGTASGGGTSALGTVYSLKLTSSPPHENTLHDFTGAEGSVPLAGLVKVGPLLYGMSHSGGSNGVGTVFSVMPDGSNFTVLHHFVYTDGASPSSGLIESGGFLYGTTQGGGSGNWGSVFKMDLSGNMVWSYGFAGGADGQLPYSGVIKVGNYLYGTTLGGGTPGQGNGTVYKIKLDGSNKQTIYTFTGGNDGSEPVAALTSFAGSLFGITKVGGISGAGTVFRVDTNGSNFQTVYAFAGGNDGAFPFASLVPVFPNPMQPGVLFGSTYGGGPANNGTLFKLTVGGVKTTVYSFTGGTDGGVPQSAVVESNGLLYGTTYGGGVYGKGTVFSIAP